MERLLAALLESGAVSAGTLDFSALLPLMDKEKTEKALALCPGARLVLCALYPYFTPGEGNVARYARGADYHREVVRRLETAAEKLRFLFPGNRFVPLSDRSPLPETAAAFLSGAGVLGKNGLIQYPGCGPYLFIGVLMSDLPFEAPPKAGTRCRGCNACAAACPTGALRLCPDGSVRYDAGRCLSYLTQKKGALSPWEEGAVAASPLIWGCDRCADACPESRKAKETSIPAFRENLIYSLSEDDLIGLPGRSFREKYGDRAFAWRGPGPLLRNLALQKKKRT